LPICRRERRSRRRRVHHARHADRPGPRGRRRRRDHAAEVDVLLPKDPNRAPDQPARVVTVKIYTRKGDDGTTGLWYGGRVAKSDPRPEAYGAVDEAASALGLCRAAAGDQNELRADILRIQNELFIAGAELATAPEAANRLEPGVTRVTEEMVERLESDID